MTTILPGSYAARALMREMIKEEQEENSGVISATDLLPSVDGSEAIDGHVVSPMGERELRFITKHGQQAFHLDSYPVEGYDIYLIYGSMSYREPEIKIVGTYVYWMGPFSFDAGETILLRYFAEQE